MPHAADKYDRLLDEAIARYADPAEAPSPRLAAARVNAAIRSQRMRRRRWLAILIPATAAVLLTVFAFRSAQPPRHPTADRRQPQPLQENPALAIVPPPAVNAVVMRHRSKEAETGSLRVLPKLDQFPSPHPLTQEEAAFVHVAANRPNTGAALRTVDQPIEIADIEIKPLAPDTEPAPQPQKDK